MDHIHRATLVSVNGFVLHYNNFSVYPYETRDTQAVGLARPKSQEEARDTYAATASGMARLKVEL